MALLLSGLSPAAADDGPAAERITMTPELKEAIQKKIDDFRTEKTVSGVSIAVVTPDESGTAPVITTFASGEQSFGSGTPVTASTQFELGSETKQFTADLLAYLVATDQVSLDDTLQEYAPANVTVPSFTDPQTGVTTEITLRDLATHEAALPDDPPNIDAGCPASGCGNFHPGYTRTLLWDALGELATPSVPQGLPFAPGTRWSYSNYGYALLGTLLSDLVEPTAGDDPPAYQEVLDQTFLTDLDLSATKVEEQLEQYPDLAQPYYSDGAEAYRWDNDNAFSGAGGLISNATDMGRWIAAHLGYVMADDPTGVQVMPGTLEQIGSVTSQCWQLADCIDPQFQTGLGWQLYAAGAQDIGVPWAFKNGGTAGSSSFTALAPSVKVGVTEMFDQAGGDYQDLAASILSLLVPVHSEPKPKPVLPATGYSGPGIVVVAGVGGALLLVGGGLLAGRRRHKPDRRTR